MDMNLWDRPVNVAAILAAIVGLAIAAFLAWKLLAAS